MKLKKDVRSYLIRKAAELAAEDMQNIGISDAELLAEAATLTDAELLDYLKDYLD